LLDKPSLHKLEWMKPNPLRAVLFTVVLAGAAMLVGCPGERFARSNASQFGHMGAYGGAIAVTSANVRGSHGKGDVPPPAPEPPR